MGQRFRTRFHRVIERPDDPVVSKELLPQRIRRDQGIHRFAQEIQSLHRLRSSFLNGGEAHSLGDAEMSRLFDRLLQIGDQLLLVADGGGSPLPGSIDREGLLQ